MNCLFVLPCLLALAAVACAANQRAVVGPHWMMLEEDEADNETDILDVTCKYCCGPSVGMVCMCICYVSLCCVFWFVAAAVPKWHGVINIMLTNE